MWKICHDHSVFFNASDGGGLYVRVCWAVTRPDGVCIHFPKQEQAVDYVSQRNGGVVPEIVVTKNGVPHERVEN